MTVVACRQLTPVFGDLAANRELTLRAIADARADIVILPELVTSGYMFESREEAAALAIAPDDELFADWAAAAGEGIVIGGFCERGADGAVYNSAAIVDRSGVLGVYRKLHLWDRERLWFAPGTEAPRVYETRFGRIGVVICYDLEFPELTRMVALAGADLLAVPTNWPLFPRPAGERPSEVVVAMATARLNHMSVACCDRGGTERGQEWTGGTTIVDQDGWVVGVERAELDLPAARDKRFTALADALADRRPELYGPLTQK
jgi:5-aminopentanamidase